MHRTGQDIALLSAYDRWHTLYCTVLYCTENILLLYWNSVTQTRRKEGFGLSTLKPLHGPMNGNVPVRVESGQTT